MWNSPIPTELDRLASEPSRSACFCPTMLGNKHILPYLAFTYVSVNGFVHVPVGTKGSKIH